MGFVFFKKIIMENIISLFNLSYLTYDSNKQIINHFSIINKQRWFINDKLKELGYKDNSEIQTLYINDFKRSKILHNKYIQK
jgi:hypothetical protein